MSFGLGEQEFCFQQRDHVFVQVINGDPYRNVAGLWHPHSPREVLIMGRARSAPDAFRISAVQKVAR
jgi:hypothetical protein